MPKDAQEKNSNISVVPNVDEDLDEDGCCRCCHCGSGQEDTKNQSYLKMREHLQQRLKAKHSICNSACDSPSGSRSSSSNCNIDGYAELDYLVKYIEGHKTPQRIGQPNPKRAAKKARQKERKLEQKRLEELAVKQQTSVKAQTSSTSTNKVLQDRVPNGMVRITHNPLTNSAVITPLYGPLEHNPSYLQQPLGLSTPQIPKSDHVSIESSKTNNIITAPKLGSTSVSSQKTPESVLTSSTASSQPQQMVTIRRVMQPNLSEPVVTVTLKGETPDYDKVLFTLVNGQVLPTEKINGVSSLPTTQSSTQLSQSSSATSNNEAAAPTSTLTAAQIKKKQKKQEKKKQKKLAASLSNYEELKKAPEINQIQGNRIATSPYEHFHQHSQQDLFSLDNFRLPPGITLTRVQGSHPPAHPELPMRMVDRSQRQDSHSVTNSSPNGASPIIVTSPLSVPKPKESLGSLGGLAAPNVIVVDTRKIQQQHQPGVPQQQPRTVQTCSVGVQTGEDGDDEGSLTSNTSGLTKQQRKKLRRKEKLLEEQAVLNQLAALQLNSVSNGKKSNDTGKKIGSTSKTTVVVKESHGQVKSTSSQATGRGKQLNSAPTKVAANNSVCATGGKTNSKKKKKSRTSTSQSSEDKWEENVFVPKSDIDLEGGDLDDDERELEAFKRFCFNTVPPERKEKVRIHLNVKDIFGKKSNGLHMTCK